MNLNAIGKRVEFNANLGDFVLNRTIKLFIVFDAVDVTLDDLIGDADGDSNGVHGVEWLCLRQGKSSIGEGATQDLFGIFTGKKHCAFLALRLTAYPPPFLKTF